MASTKKTSLMLTDGVHAKLKKLAKDNHRTLSGMVTVLILEYTKPQDMRMR